MTALPFSQACENNKKYIFNEIHTLLATANTVLEIGTGTAQHAEYFACQCPHLQWQTADLHQNHAGILARINNSERRNLLAPIPLDVKNQADWPSTNFDMVYSSNTSHIMSWPENLAMFKRVGTLLLPQHYFVLYGPFKVANQFTTASNERFDQHLKSQNQAMGLRDLEVVVETAEINNLILQNKKDMPANNFLLLFKKR